MKQSFRALGFSEGNTLDLSDFEGADIIFNLNESECPDPLRDKYDVIYENGTLEHISHVPNALANMHEMLKINGRIILCMPTSNLTTVFLFIFISTV